MVHLTIRQGFEIEGIRFEDMDAINKKLQPIINLVETNQEVKGEGYPTSGTRNISACIKGCKSLSVAALSMNKNYKIVRDTEKCIGCGVCVTKCPTRALTRSRKKYYKLAIMGRTGKPM